MHHVRLALCLCLAAAPLTAQAPPPSVKANDPAPGGMAASPAGAPEPAASPAGAPDPAAPAGAGDAELALDASNLDIRYGGKATSGAKVSAKLGPLVRRALNTWAGLAHELELTVIVPEHADVLVLGTAPIETLTSAARWADEASALFDKCQPAGGATARGAVVMALFDSDGFESPAWPGLLDALLARNMITRDCAEGMKTAPGSLMVRQSLFFTQHTWDMVGNAFGGDDEYRIGNEIAHKTAQLLVEARFGRQPEVLRWGIGYVAEQRLFGNIYQFNASGFVASDDHFGWPAKTIDGLKKSSKLDSFSLVDTIMNTAQPGTTMTGQRDAWAVLDYSLAKDPAQLAALFAELGALHHEADPRNGSMDYKGDAEKALAACEKAWGALKVAALCDHLKRVK